jgi:hypothetical protein
MVVHGRSAAPKLGLVAILLFSFPSKGQLREATSGEGLARGLRKNVVRVCGSGFGFIVGERSGQLYIVTPNHVVEDCSGKPRAITLSFFSRPGESVAARVLTGNTHPDLAVLQAAAPPNFSWERNCEADIHKLIVSTGTDDLRGLRAWFVGRSADSKNIWFVPSNPGLINGGPNTEELIAVEITTVLPGTSGAPLITDSGIVGMIIQEENAGVARALSLDYIRRFFRERQLEWSLKAPADSSSIPEIAAVAASIIPRSGSRGEIPSVLIMSGTGFGSSGVKVFVNGKDVSKQITTIDKFGIQLRGLTRELNLVSGLNRVYVVVSGQQSNAYEFTQRF